MKKTTNIYNQISEIVSAHISSMEQKVHGVIRNALITLLGNNAEKYSFVESADSKTNAELQISLSKINEKSEIRKNNGVYYTPEDVCKYIVWNSIIMMLDSDNHRTYKEKDAIDKVLQYPQETINRCSLKELSSTPHVERENSYCTY